MSAKFVEWMWTSFGGWKGRLRTPVLIDPFQPARFSKRSYASYISTVSFLETRAELGLKSLHFGGETEARTNGEQPNHDWAQLEYIELQERWQKRLRTSQLCQRNAAEDCFDEALAIIGSRHREESCSPFWLTYSFRLWAAVTKHITRSVTTRHVGLSVLGPIPLD
jgi:hypothetical protein